MNTRELTIEGIDKVRGNNTYVDTIDNTLHSVRISLSSSNPKQYWGLVTISNKKYPNQKYTWILNRRERTLSIYKGKRNKPCYSTPLTPNDLETPQSLRNLIGDNVWEEHQMLGTRPSGIPAPYAPF